MAVDWTQWANSYLPDVYGPLYGAGSVKAALVNTLELWLPSYIAEINRQFGTPVLVVPKDYLYRPDERTITAKTSQIMVTVPGTVGVPERRKDGTRAVFDGRVTWFFAGTSDWNEAEAIAQAGAAAVLGAVAQHPSLGDFAETTLWQGVQIGAEDRSSTLWRLQAINRFHVSVMNVMSPFGGPPAPSVATPAAVGTVSSENVTIGAPLT